MENKEILKKFDSVTSELIRLLSSLSESELNEAPKLGKWSLAQIGEHLYKSYEISAVLNGHVKNIDRAPDEKLDEVEKLFLNFNIKMDSPKEIIPEETPIEKEDLITKLKERINEQKEVIKHQDLTMLCLDFEIPEYGPFTRLEWVGFNAVHTERHLQQMKEILKSKNN
ncbi:DinB family protein [Marivirga sp. S37H4]|uniref:DinB family protein n=1 Tax=Marivirga aurantiaca TaxID=2802615 RepID=A0A934X0P0_9BACT|nr:DinB family protein [Marivirga aurantiaca]MBK6266210.1 DinB family protein [Marivirga aurantiaca]